MSDQYQEYLNETFKDLTHIRKSDCWGNELHVAFKISKKLWDKLAKDQQLGRLYGTDLGNFLSRKGILNEYSVPRVDHQSRAIKGLKHIWVTYNLKVTS